MAQYDSQPEMIIDLDKTYSATLHTNHGDINIEFDAVKSPLTVNNFVFLARDGFYDGVIFHRVIKGFMIQGGDPTGTGMGGPGYRFRDELEGPGRYSRGTVAMANAGPNTNGSQFFIMHNDYGLPHNYSIFGQVTDGLDVVDTIATTPTGPQDRPHDDCVINSVTITEG
jgi:cyclophilin family peptidyl-prolyl cis-trans isomerase